MFLSEQLCGGNEERCKRSNGAAVNMREGEDYRPEALLTLCLMMLTDIIEFYKCFKSLSGAMVVVNGKNIEGKGKRKRGERGNNHSPKCLKNCCGKALECYYGPPGKENRQRFTPLI